MKRSLPLLLACLLAAPSVVMAAGGSRADAVRLYKEGRFKESAEVYEALIERQPRDLSLARDYMWTLWNGNYFADAAKAADLVLRLAPADVEALNLKAKALLKTGDAVGARSALQRSLEEDERQDHVRKTLGNLYVDDRDFGAAVDEFQHVLARHPDRTDVLPELGKALLYQWRYDEAAGVFARVVKLFPDRTDYQYHYARALYYSGHPDEGLAILKAIPSSDPVYYWRAIDFIVDDALATGHHEAAAEILEQHLTELRHEDAPRLIKLAKTYFEHGQSDRAFRALQRGLNINPKNGPLLLSKADFLLAEKRFAEACDAYSQAADVHPMRANRGLAECWTALNRPADALTAVRKARSLDPTDPDLLLQEASLLYDTGDRPGSHTLLTQWLALHTDTTTLPVLLYHGITPFQRDPALAYSIHLTTAAFNEHMRGLHDAGMTPVTTADVRAWFLENKPLPPNPVLISFDDTRMDSFVYGDAALARYGLKATMFASLVNVEGTHPPAFARWTQLKKFAQNGRWEIQAHGDLAHIYVPIDSEGRKGLFLLNRQWLEAEKRFETDDEWRRRAEADHESVRRKIAKELGQDPRAYSFPESAYGQTNAVTNIPDVMNANLAAIEKVFPISFIQNGTGLNTKTRDPRRLFRVEPDGSLSGAQLVKKLRDTTPFVKVTRRLLAHAVWDDKPQEAESWLASLKQYPVSPGILALEEGRIRAAQGDVEAARPLLEKAWALEKDPEAQKLLASLDLPGRVEWSPFAHFDEDNRDRTRWSVGQDLTIPLRRDLELGLGQRHAVFEERHVPTIREERALVSLSGLLQRRHRLTAEAGWNAFWHHTANTYSARGSWTARWRDGLTTSLAGGRSPYDTAAALNAGISSAHVTGGLEWSPAERWTILPEGDYAHLSDGNDRAGGTVLVKRGVPLPGVSGLYRFYYDDMDFVSPAYYSPREAIGNQLGLEWAPVASKRWSVLLRYLAGPGHERGTRTLFVQDAEAEFSWAITPRTSIQPSLSLIRTPTYRRDGYRLTLRHKF